MRSLSSAILITCRRNMQAGSWQACTVLSTLRAPKVLDAMLTTALRNQDALAKPLQIHASITNSCA